MIKRFTSKLPSMSTSTSVEEGTEASGKEPNGDRNHVESPSNMLKKLTIKFSSIPDLGGQMKSPDNISNPDTTGDGQTMFKRISLLTSKFPSIPTSLTQTQNEGPKNSSDAQVSHETTENNGSSTSSSSSQYSTPDLSKYINSATATAAASSMYGMMKKAQTAASVMIKEGSVKAAEIKKKAVEVADMDALQRRLGSALDSGGGDGNISSMNFTYITDRIIAMGFPGNNAGTPIRGNPMDPIAKFLNEKHPSQYMIWNLSEEPYDYSKVTDQVLEFKFPGHPAPPLDEKNVAVVHCLTGKGRTGTVIACFLAWTAEYSSPMEALQFVSQKRETSIEKMTIPSQRRYLHYFANLLDGVKPRSSPLLLRRVIINSIPIFSIRTTNEVNEAGETIQVESKGCCPYLQIFKGGKLVYTTTWGDAESNGGVKWASVNDGSASFSVDCMLQGDILLRCRHLSDSGPRISMFRAAFHTGYIPLGILRLTKAQLDGACQDERFEQDFFVDLIFAPVQTDAKGQLEGAAPGAHRTEGVSISEEDKHAYDVMLEKDERFWADIATRKELRMKKNGSEVKNDQRQQQDTLFSIFGGDEDQVHVESGGMSRRGSWDAVKDDELMAHIDSLTSSQVVSLNRKSSFSPKKVVVSSVDILSSENKSATSDDTHLDAEIAELAKLEEELGLESFSEHLKDLPSTSAVIKSPKTHPSKPKNNGPYDDSSKDQSSTSHRSLDTSFDFLDEQLSLSTDTHSQSASVSSLDIGNENFDELEEYLKTLTSGKK